MSQLPIETLGRKAHSLVASGGKGEVLAVFSSIAYLLTDQDELLWLSGRGSPMHRRCLRTAGPLPALAPGAAFSFEGARLVIEPSIEMDLRRASVWEAQESPAAAAIGQRSIPQRARALVPRTLHDGRPRGLGRLIPQVLDLADGRAPRGEAEEYDLGVLAAWPAVRSLAGAALRRETSHILEGACDLLGLGQGLTPSGDDFLGGFLFGLRRLRREEPSIPDLPPLRAFLQMAAQKTNRISFTLLHDLADGHAVEPLHRCLDLLLGGHPLEHAHEALRRLTSLGHSTGWDLWTGALCSLLFAFPSPRTGRTPDAPIAETESYARS